jgi:hypothetical protein
MILPNHHDRPIPRSWSVWLYDGHYFERRDGRVFVIPATVIATRKRKAWPVSHPRKAKT